MASDTPVLSAFAARKRLLAKANLSKSPGTKADDSGGDAASSDAQDAQDAQSPASCTTRRESLRSTAGRLKRQRVEPAAGQGQEQKMALRSGTKPEAKRGRQATKKRETAEEPAQSLDQPLVAPSLTAEMDVDGEVRAAKPSPRELRSRDAISGTPPRKSSTSAPSTPAIPAPVPAQFPFYVNKEVVRDSMTQKDNGVVEIRIDSEERLRLPIVGQYGVRVVRGEVTVAGATLRPSREITWICSSLCYSAPVLRCPESSVLELHQHPTSGGLRSLGRLSPLFRGIWNRMEPHDDNHNASAYKILYGPEDLPKKSVFRPIYSAPEWNKKIAELADTIISAPIFVCGPKGSGKSTFTRLLANRLLTRTQQRPRRRSGGSQGGVVVLDLDPGQPEFCPAGTASLVLVQKPNISPPFAHPWPNNSSTTLIRCHALASVTPGSDTDLYTACALDLYDHYQRNWNGYPLIVNTPGWILGTGLDLLSLLITSIRPGEVVYMSEDGPAETLEGLQSACKKTSTFSALPSQQSDSAARKTAAQLRAMQTMAYFHAQGAAAGTEHFSWNPSPLTTVPPWRVRYSGANRGFAGIMCYGSQPDPALLAEAISGMVLAAVEIEDERAFRRRDPEEEDAPMGVGDAPGAISDYVESITRRTPEGIPYFEQGEGETLDPRYSRAVGLVLVRGVDAGAGALQVLTPMARSTLEEIRLNGRHVVLVHGQFDAPTWAYTEDLYEQEFKGEGAEDEDEEDSDGEGGPGPGPGGQGVGVNRPWVEGVDDKRRRQAGGGTWRVRRDLGKQNR